MTVSLARRILARRSEWPVLIEAIIWLGLAWLWLRFLPGGRVARLLRPTVSGMGGRSPHEEEIERVAWAIGAAARRLPWRAVCFHQGIAIQRMLSRRAIAVVLHCGVGKAEDGALTAHVWGSVGDAVVIGDGDLTDYTVLAKFHCH